MSKKMTQYLQQQMKIEAAIEEKDILENQELDDIQVPPDMYDKVMEKIQAYEDEIAMHPPTTVVAPRHCAKKRIKLWLLLAAVLILAMGMSVTSVGSKPFIWEFFEQMTGNENVTQVETQKSERKMTEGVGEVEAYEAIEKALGFQPPRLRYQPEGMKFDSYTSSEVSAQTKIFYNYKNETIITYTIVTEGVDSSFSATTGDELMDEYELRVGDKPVQMSKYKISETGEEEWAATFSDSYANYSVFGVVEKDVFEKIIQNIYFYQ